MNNDTMRVYVDECDSIIAAMNKMIAGFDQATVEASSFRAILESSREHIPVTDDNVYNTHWGSDYTVAARAGRSNSHFNKVVAKRRARNKAARKARRHG